MKAFAVIAILSLLLLLGCTQPAQKAGAPAGGPPSTVEPVAQPPIPTPGAAAGLSDADLKEVDTSLSELDSLLSDLDSADFEDSGITADTFK